MTLLEAIQSRHSVRAYQDRKIEPEHRQELLLFIEECNRESGLRMQLVLEEAAGFAGFLASYGLFSGVKNYIAIVGKKEAGIEEKCGYYGEKVVLRAQQLGLNTCWVGGTFSKRKTVFAATAEEKLYLVIAVGYGQTQGKARRSKSIERVAKAEGDMPEWFRKGVEAALLAPTALNQQKFQFILRGNTVQAVAGVGPFSHLDLGIAKCHFEIGAGEESFIWL